MAFQSLKDGQEIQNSLTLFLFLNKSFLHNTPTWGGGENQTAMNPEVSVEIYYVNPAGSDIDKFKQDLSQQLKNGWEITSVISPSEYYLIYTFKR